MKAQSQCLQQSSPICFPASSLRYLCHLYIILLLPRLSDDLPVQVILASKLLNCRDSRYPEVQGVCRNRWRNRHQSLLLLYMDLLAICARISCRLIYPLHAKQFHSLKRECMPRMLLNTLAIFLRNKNCELVWSSCSQVRLITFPCLLAV